MIGTIAEGPAPLARRVQSSQPVLVSAAESKSGAGAHELPDGAFDALAEGAGSLTAIDAMAQARMSVTRALVAAVAAETGGRDADLRQAAAEGWTMLCELDARRPEIVAEIFAHPYAAAWAIRCLSPAAGADVGLDRAHLVGLAVAAALKAGVTAELAVPLRDGLLHLPTLGAVAIDSASARMPRIRVEAGLLTIPDSGTWLPARRISGPVLHTAVDDLDPFRDCQKWPITGRLSGPEWRVWQTALDASSRRLDGLLPSYARVLAAGLRAVVPLRPSTVGLRSSTARQAYGAVALALPADRNGVEELLVHEFQHVKLNVLLDMYELFDTRDTRRLRVPWREDPRPVEGVLHGIYAHLALCHLWQAHGPAARGKYLRYRAWVLGAAEALAATGTLSAYGDRFVAGMVRGAADDQ